MQRFAIAAMAFFALAACATTYGPRYERASGPGDIGYYANRIDDNRYVVQYRADRGDPYVAQDFAFRRAAELTLEQRYDWFQVISRSRAMGDDVYGRYDRFRYYPGERYDRPGYGAYDDNLAVIEIIMGNNPPPRGGNIYDARRLLDSMRRDDYNRY